MLRLLRPYRAAIAALMVLGLLSNGLGLALPKLIGSGMNAFGQSNHLDPSFIHEFMAVSLLIVLFTYLQTLVQVNASERVARDLRKRLVERVSEQTYSFVLERKQEKLLTHLTSDVDAVKAFVAQAVATIISSVVILIGASVLLLSLNFGLGLLVLTIVPLIGVIFAFVMSRVRSLFKRTREIVDSLNKIVKEDITGAALVRVLDAGPSEVEKFGRINDSALVANLTIVKNFAMMIPSVVLLSNLATWAVLTQGGKRVIAGSIHLGDLAAFNSYLALLIFPIFMLGFMGNVISQARASYGRISDLLEPVKPPVTGLVADLKGDVEARELRLSFGEREVLQGVSLQLPAGSRTAIIGPTAAGKTLLLNLLVGLLEPASGEVLYDGRPLADYDPESLRRQVALVFQESILFGTTLRENVAFRQDVSGEHWKRAVETAELQDFIDKLAQGLDTQVSERGTSLSGGQKQRIMLARALATGPRILLLDDFTARLDPQTEARVLANLRANYPGLTLLTVTQRIAPVRDYDSILLMMEGSILARGTHDELLATCPEYMQIYESQRSTEHYG